MVEWAEREKLRRVGRRSIYFQRDFTVRVATRIIPRFKEDAIIYLSKKGFSLLLSSLPFPLFFQSSFYFTPPTTTYLFVPQQQEEDILLLKEIFFSYYLQQLSTLQLSVWYRPDFKPLIMEGKHHGDKKESSGWRGRGGRRRGMRIMFPLSQDEAKKKRWKETSPPPTPLAD